MGYVMFGSIYPVPEWPYSLIPYLFAAYIMSGVLCYGVIVNTTPNALLAMQLDLE